MLFDFFDNNDNFDENTSWNNEVSTTKKFSKKEKESFLSKVKKATLAEIEPTSDIVLDQGDTPGIEDAVEFLGWAEVLPEFGDQIDYPKDKNGMTPLHFAAGFGNTEAISTLLNLGADANRQDKIGLVPVFYSRIFRQTDALQLFGSHEKSCECKN